MIWCDLSSDLEHPVSGSSCCWLEHLGGRRHANEAEEMDADGAPSFLLDRAAIGSSQ